MKVYVLLVDEKTGIAKATSLNACEHLVEHTFRLALSALGEMEFSPVEVRHLWAKYKRATTVAEVGTGELPFIPNLVTKGGQDV